LLLKTGLRFYVLSLLFAFVGTTPCLAQAGFGGPSILSRGGNTPGRRGTELIGFNFYAGLTASYTTDSVGLGITPTGNGDNSVYTGSAVMGLSGSHTWRHSGVGLDLRGGYSRASISSYLTGGEVSVDLAVSMQPKRRLSIAFQELGGTSGRAFGGYFTPGVVTSDYLGLPTTNIFDSRYYFLQSSAMMSYKLSQRTFVQIQGDWFAVRQQAAFLVGVDGWRAGLSLGRQFTRRDRIALQYSYSQYTYPRAFGASDINSISLNYTRTITRQWNLALSAGYYRVETLGTEEVPLSPEIAAILGQGTGIKAVYRIDHAPSADVRLTYSRDRSTFTLSGTMGSSPGNGVYLTSKQIAASIGYSYTGIRKLSLGANISYTQYQSLFQNNLGTYGYYSGGLNAAYALTGHFRSTLQADYRAFNVSGRNEHGVTVTVGLVWTPKEFSLPGW
jgi:hypothetical protein